jgi:hypothetical protein
MMATECLRKLGWLAVTDASGDLTNSEPVFLKEFSGLIHTNAREVVPESRLAHLGECPLELPTGRCNPSSDLIKLKVFAVLGLDQLAHLVVKVGPVADCAWALGGHIIGTHQ